MDILNFKMIFLFLNVPTYQLLKKGSSGICQAEYQWSVALLAVGYMYFMPQDHNSDIGTLHWSELFLQQDLTPASLIESILTFIVFGILVNTVSFQWPGALSNYSPGNYFFDILLCRDAGLNSFHSHIWTGRWLLIPVIGGLERS